MDLIFLHINTTDLDSHIGGIFQISAIATSNDEYIDFFDYYILPSSISNSNYFNNNYDVNVIKTYPNCYDSFVEIQSEIYKFMQKYKSFKVLCYDKAFMLQFLNKKTSIFNDLVILDSKELLRYMIPLLYVHDDALTLENVFKVFNIELDYKCALQKATSLASVFNIINSEVCQRMDI